MASVRPLMDGFHFKTALMLDNISALSAPGSTMGCNIAISENRPSDRADAG
jgi:hypothetical protein